MLSPPVDLSEYELLDALRDGWGLEVASAEYLPVGFGSHHWAVVEGDGRRRFVSVDDLDSRRRFSNEPIDGAFQRLSAALAAARDLKDSGLSFVVAPILASGGQPLVRLNQQFAAALYPHVEGESFSWGQAQGPEQSRDLLNLIATLHACPPTAAQHALAEDFAVPQRDILETALDGAAGGWDGGPYASRTATLISENAHSIRRLVALYDDLVDEFSRSRPRMVMTHGEPHPGNTMATATGLVLIDWDTALRAPPERDLWMLDPGDGSTNEAYRAITGRTLLPPILELYRIRWDLADLTAYVHGFWRSHSGDLDDDQSWDQLRLLIERLAG